MALILSLETTTSVCSVALALDGKLIGFREQNSRNAHAEILNAYIEEVLAETHYHLSDLNAVAVSEGPGSYTGLRIGVSTAKGLCYSLDIPLISVSTLQSLASFTRENIPQEILNQADLIFCPMIDARRMEAYTSHFTADLKILKEVEAEIIDETTYANLLDRQLVVFSGDGCGKYQKLYEGHEKGHFYPNILASARGMCVLAEDKFSREEFADLAYFEPFYLKSFVAGIPKVKGLR
jgi:tRNA threonylcarbamoyladenosine biosynthesis protein TsaB